jgi:hypothetical protein
VLEAHGDGCSSLAQATTVTLALLLDAQLRVRPEPAKPSTASEEQSPAPARVERAPSASELHFMLGGGALLGVLRPTVPVLSLEGGLSRGWFRAGLGGLWAIPQTVALGPGRVHELLFAGTARGCFALARSSGTRLDACSGLFAGAQRAEAAGYTTNSRRTRSWFAVPLELALSQRSGPLGLELGGSFVLPLVRNEFVIDGQGPAYSPAPLSVLLSLRVFGIVPW